MFRRLVFPSSALALSLVVATSHSRMEDNKSPSYQIVQATAPKLDEWELQKQSCPVCQVSKLFSISSSLIGIRLTFSPHAVSNSKTWLCAQIALVPQIRISPPAQRSCYHCWLVRKRISIILKGKNNSQMTWTKQRASSVCLAAPTQLHQSMK
jgi:hypothetical protein